MSDFLVAAGLLVVVLVYWRMGRAVRRAGGLDRYLAERRLRETNRSYLRWRGDKAQRAPMPPSADAQRPRAGAPNPQR